MKRGANRPLFFMVLSLPCVPVVSPPLLWELMTGRKRDAESIRSVALEWVRICHGHPVIQERARCFSGAILEGWAALLGSIRLLFQVSMASLLGKTRATAGSPPVFNWRQVMHKRESISGRWLMGRRPPVFGWA